MTLTHPAPTIADEPETARAPGRPRDPVVTERFYTAAITRIELSGLQAVTVNQLTIDIQAGKASFYRRWPNLNQFLADLVRHLRAHPDSVVTADAVVAAGGRILRDLVEGDDR